MVKPLALALLLGAACTNETVVSPVIDSPAGDDAAAGFPGLTAITMSVAVQGSTRDLVSHTFNRGEPLVLPGAPFGDELVIHMVGFQGTSAVSYGRTCPFLVASGRNPVPPHLFFSRTVHFASLPFTPLNRHGGRAVPYVGGAIFIGGQDRSGLALVNIERFDPETGTYLVLGSVEQRTGAVDALLGTSPPRVAVIGGSLGNDLGADFLELIDPNRNVERIEDAQGNLARTGLTATSLGDGRVIAIGGNPPGMPAVGTIVAISDTGGAVDVRQLHATLAHPRTGHTATLLGSDLGAPILIAGGSDTASGGAPIAVAELFKPLSEELAKPTTFAPAMIVPRTQHHAALMPDGSVLIIGGVDATNQPVRQLELFSLDAGFVSVGLLPASAGVVDITTTVLPDGRVLIAGGRTAPGGPPVHTAFIARLDPLSGSVDVVGTDRLAVERAGHQAVLLCDGTVLVTGGTDLDAPAERYNPPSTDRR